MINVIIGKDCYLFVVWLGHELFGSTAAVFARRDTVEAGGFYKPTDSAEQKERNGHNKSAKRLYGNRLNASFKSNVA